MLLKKIKLWNMDKLEINIIHTIEENLLVDEPSPKSISVLLINKFSF